MIPTFTATKLNDLEIEFDDGPVRRKLLLRSRKIEHALGASGRVHAIAEMLTAAVQPQELKK